MSTADLRDRIRVALGAQYAVEREIGRGGMGTVFLAEDLKHGRRVALKILHAELAVSVGPDRFRREIALAAKLQHPHILAIHDSGQTADGQLWFSMPYVEGESLRDRLRRDKQLSVDDTVRIARQIADALDYAHRKGIIHRDVKPENILFSAGHALLADFGVARAIEPPTSLGDAEPPRVTSLTHSGFAVGTPAYMSPEQASGERTLDGRSDLYALAAVVYEMLAGETPFTASTPQALIAKLMASAPPSVRVVRRDVPLGVDAAIRKALSPVPVARFGSTAAFAAALEAGLTTGTADPRPHRRRLIAGIAAGAVLLAAGAAYAWRAHTGAASGPVMLAVLPFDNIGDSSDAYFADGITDEIRSKLTALGGLQVIASGSSNQYRSTREAPEQIGRELGVRYLLVGRVRWDKHGASGGQTRVRVEPELVQVADVRTPTTKWQQSIDAPLVDVFQVQAQIASAVADHLRITLGEGERATLAGRPTQNLDAYDAYLRGLSYVTSGNTAVAQRRAAAAFAQAAQRDPSFRMAWVALARARTNVYATGARSNAARDSARDAARRAVEVAPDLPEAHAALSYYYSAVEHDFGRALTEAAQARRANSAVLLDQTAYAEGHLGRWDSAVTHLQLATHLDPRDADVAADLGFALLYERRYVEARAALDRALGLAPTDLTLIEWRAMASLGDGDLAGARAVLNAVPPSVDRSTLAAYLAASRGLVWVLDDAQLRLVVGLGPAAFDDDRAEWALTLAQAHAALANADRSRAFADTARAAYELAVRGAGDQPASHAALGLALAYLGRTADATREAERAVSLLPMTTDSRVGAAYEHQLARVYTLTGQPARALDALAVILRNPGYVSAAWLRIDPTFAPLRNLAGFQHLVGGSGPTDGPPARP